ncbi:MAG: carbohydrate binding domain-containing protein, partial [Muribaculaceae bacterium]|nr:carbohydrate binding domain-containing protein [Muribaculaceae bacterium]
MYNLRLFAAAAAMAVAASASAATNHLTLQTNKLGAEVKPTMYGLFFEDINYAADGGLYAELIKNRSFEFPDRLTGWVPFGGVEVREDGPFDRNPHYVRLTSAGHAHKHTGIENEGFFGVPFKKGEEYRCSVWARVPDGGKAKLKILLVDTKSMPNSQDIAKATITVDSKEWKKYTAVLTPSLTEEKGKLRIFLERPETTVDLEHISLFPADTWNGHENGLRRDLAQKLADLKPGVFRFPGGCIVE